MNSPMHEDEEEEFGENERRIETYHGRQHRVVHIVIGQTYHVEPLNPLKKKHRGRICKVVGWAPGAVFTNESADVKFLDNGRRGHVEFSDLIPYDPTSEPTEASSS